MGQPACQANVGRTFECGADLHGPPRQALLAAFSAAREACRMIPAFIAAIAVSTALHVHPKRKRHVAAPRQNTLASERVLRRRVVRLALIAQLTRRESELEDFLASAETETPLMRMGKAVLSPGVEIGPTSITSDFLGSPIVRATVRNRSAALLSGVLTAHIADAGGKEIALSYAVEAVAPGASQAVELLCSAPLMPISLRWTMQPW